MSYVDEVPRRHLMNGFSYAAEVLIWLLTKTDTANCKIWLNMTKQYQKAFEKLTFNAI